MRIISFVISNKYETFEGFLRGNIMDFKSVILEFESCFPQIREYGENRVAWYAGKGKKNEYEKIKAAGPYAYFYDYVNHYTVDLLSEKQLSPCLPRLFLFIEKMAESDDCAVTDLLKVELLEHIRDQSYSIYQLALSLMGPKTRELEKSLDDYMGKPTPENISFKSDKKHHKRRTGRL